LHGWHDQVGRCPAPDAESLLDHHVRGRCGQTQRYGTLDFENPRWKIERMDGLVTWTANNPNLSCSGTLLAIPGSTVEGHASLSQCDAGRAQRVPAGAFEGGNRNPERPSDNVFRSR